MLTTTLGFLTFPGVCSWIIPRIVSDWSVLTTLGGDFSGKCCTSLYFPVSHFCWLYHWKPVLAIER